MNTPKLHLTLKQLVPKQVFNKKLSSPFFIKLFNWEYWSFSVIYTPIYFYWFYLCAKAKSLFFFSASNPTIENGGFLLEKKSDIYKIIPQQYYPKTLLVPVNYSSDVCKQLIDTAGFNFPAIVKPDIGGRGRGVRKVNNIDEAVEYIAKSQFSMLIQNFVEFENEVGIFYYRYPWEASGKISGIVEKEFLTITGDGISTIEELVLQNERYKLQLPALKKMGDVDLSEIVSKNQQKILVPFGNHARGAKFIDSSHKITLELQNAIDAICQKIPGFYFGRLDIKFNNWDELSKGENLSIIELNGAGSEPTHMYDPNHSIFFAWKEIIKHWKILYKISQWNKQHNKGVFLTFKQGLSMFKENRNIERKLNNL